MKKAFPSEWLGILLYKYMSLSLNQWCLLSCTMAAAWELGLVSVLGPETVETKCIFIESSCNSASFSTLLWVFASNILDTSFPPHPLLTPESNLQLLRSWSWRTVWSFKWNQCLLLLILVFLTSILNQPDTGVLLVSFFGPEWFSCLLLSPQSYHLPTSHHTGPPQEAMLYSALHSVGQDWGPLAWIGPRHHGLQPIFCHLSYSLILTDSKCALWLNMSIKTTSRISIDIFSLCPYWPEWMPFWS